MMPKLSNNEFDELLSEHGIAENAKKASEEKLTGEKFFNEMVQKSDAQIYHGKTFAYLSGNEQFFFDTLAGETEEVLAEHKAKVRAV